MRACTTQFLIGLALLLACTAPAAAHAPPPIYFIMDLDEVALHVKFTFSADLFRDWVTSLWSEESGVVEDGPLIERMEQFLADALSIEADGVVVRPVVMKLEARWADAHGGKHHYVDVAVEYGMKGRLRSLGIAWTKYDNTIGAGVAPIDTELTAYGKLDYPVFTEKEPGYVWHAPLEPRADRSARPPHALEPETVTVPVVSAGLLLLLLVLLPILLLRRVRWASVIGVLAVGLAAAFFLRGVAQTEVRPPWRSGFRMPAEAEAAQVFEDLHRNIYRAFDYDTEDAVYDTLAQSVEGELLDTIYIEVYRSLILEDEGGAVCKIQKVDVLETAVELPEDDDLRAFHAVCRWRVRGKVGHWGHTHIRVNEYRARYRVHHDDGAWRIDAAELLEQKRVER